MPEQLISSTPKQLISSTSVSILPEISFRIDDWISSRNGDCTRMIPPVVASYDKETIGFAVFEIKLVSRKTFSMSSFQRLIFSD